jgi:hypothetical protein
MKNRRNFVTCFVLLVSLVAAVVGCNRPQRDPVKTGNQKLVQLQSVQSELKAQGVSLDLVKAANGKAVSEQVWQKYSAEQLARISDLLKQYLTNVDQLLSIDAEKNVYIQNKDIVVARREQAQAHLNSLNEFLKQRSAVQVKPVKSA